MGGKSTQSTQQVTIPPAVLAQYQAVNARANQTANTPFSTYGGEFVAPVNSQQSTGIGGINTAANEAQPYFSAATDTINSAQAGTVPYNTNAATGLSAAQSGTQPYNTAAAGILANTVGQTQPVNNAALGLAGASAQQVNPSNLDAASIEKYMNPYLNTVLGSTASLLNQNNQQQQAGQLGTAIQSGAFGGDRTGLAAANLEQQQNLANANIYSGIASNAFDTALGVAQQQQGVGLAAGQANRAALASAGNELAQIGQTQFGEGVTGATTAAGLGQTAYGEAANTSAQEAALGQTAYGEGANTSTTLAGLGTGAQTAALQGAQAQVGAGTLEQQTQQAQDTALYNQFLQQQSYPFQVDQFLANIAEGTGALSGSTTTTTQPGGFFSDRRLKHSIRKIGKTYDGQPIYSYKMHGDPRTHVGLIAQNVERKHPDAVGLAAGYKTVDYGKATEHAANRGHFDAGGVASAGGRVWHPAAYAYGGSPSIVDPVDLSAILQAQGQMYAPYAGAGGPYGASGSVPRGGSSRVPAPTGATPHLVTAGGLAARQTPAQNTKEMLDTANTATNLYKAFNKPSTPKTTPAATAPSVTPAPTPGDTPPPIQETTTTTTPGGMMAGLAGAEPANDDQFASRGGHFATGGKPYSYDRDPTELDIPDENAHNQLVKAPDLPKPSPTGFQQLMSAGQGSSGMMSGLGGMFGGGSGAAGAAGGASDAGAVISDAYLSRGGGLKHKEFNGGREAPSRPLGGLIPFRRRRDVGGANSDAVDAASTDRNAGVGADTPDATLAIAPPLAQSGRNSSLDTVAKYAKDAYTAYQLYGMYAAAAAKRGGRIGYADGGAPDDPDSDVINPQGVARGVINRNPKAPDLLYTRDAGSVVPYAAPPAPGLAAPRPAPNQDMGGANFGVNNPKTWNNDPNPGLSGSGGAGTQGPPAPSRSPEQISGITYPSGLAGASAVPDVSSPARVPVDNPSWWDKIKNSEMAKPENLIPLLSALGAMGTAPTKHLGVALAAGAGAGAQSYLNTQQSLANTAETRAQVPNIQAETQGRQIQNLAELQNQYALKGLALYPDPNGPIQGPNGQRYVAKPKTASMGAGAGSQTQPAQYNYLGKNGMEAAKNEGVGYTIAPDANKAASAKQIDDIYSSGNEAQSRMATIQRWEQTMAANPTGPLKPGALEPMRIEAANMWNTMMDQAGHPEYKVNGLADAQMADKTSRGAAAMQEAGNQQRSFNALKAFLQQTPNVGMQREAALPLIADLHMENQQNIDKKNYIDEFDKETQRNYGPLPRNYLATDALQSFDKDYPANNYQGERNNLATIIQSGGFAKLSSELQNASPDKKQKLLQALDSKYGPNFHRYFTGS